MHPPLRKTTWICLAATLLTMSGAHAAEEKSYQFGSGPDKVRMMELYTSQSRSSCLPAEAWFSTLREDPDLWNKITPVSFHISHWDDRGWKDRLSAPEFTERFIGWLSRWRASTPYVPIVALDGVEWSGWAKEQSILASASRAPAGILTVKKISENEYRVLYAPEKSTRGPWVLSGALLGFGVPTHVESGENVGKNLRQDFVALKVDRRPMESTRDGFRATLHLPTKGTASSLAKEGMGLAVWVGRGDDLLPVQSAGSFLPGYRKKK